MTKCYTDYPLILPEEEGKRCPIREVKFISYDGDKECKVKWNGEIHWIKACYLYAEKGRIASGCPRPKLYIYENKIIGGSK